jgi:glycine/D-amino acid oxidase-like deaminating enzyme
VSPDVVVIGGGIVGSACAYYLSRAGVRVLLVEKGAPASGTSKACQCHVVLWEQPEINMRLGRASRLLYEELAEGLPFDIEYRQTGSLAVVEDPADWPEFVQTIRSLQALGLNCGLLSPDDLAYREPNLARDLAGGASFPEDGQVNPIYAALALAGAARQNGATIQYSTEVNGVERSQSGAVTAVTTTAGRIPTQAVVNAAGVWSAKVGRMVGIEIPVKPRRGHIVVTEPLPYDIINCKIILAAGYMQTLTAGGGIALAANIQQTRNGNILLGSSREFAGFDWSVSGKVIRDMVARNLRFLPALRGAHAIRSYAGLRPYSPDLVPILGRVDAVDGFYVACGHEGAGITMGPISGKLICEVITGQEPSLPLEQLSLSRFDHQANH